MQAKESLTKAIKAAGGIKKLAAAIGHRDNVVHNWVARANERMGVPRDNCPAVERETGVPCEDLYPAGPWHRVPDAEWPNPAGRPLLDLAADRVSA